MRAPSLELPVNPSRPVVVFVLTACTIWALLPNRSSLLACARSSHAFSGTKPQLGAMGVPANSGHDRCTMCLSALEKLYVYGMEPRRKRAAVCNNDSAA